MGFYIKDLGMPNRNQSIHIEIKNGKPRVTGRTDTNGYEELDCEIVEIKTPHGRLIDEDFIKKVLGERVCIAKRDPNGDLIAMLSVSLLPTVIEAEEEE